MILTDLAWKYILYQRTGTASRDQIIASYKQDANIILKYARPKNMLDIGCGVCGVECFIPDANFYLIDRTTSDESLKKVFYGYKTNGAYYNSRQAAIELLKKNGVSENRIYYHDATDDNAILFDQEFDLVISLLSCGFHYPVSSYLDKIYEKLISGGKLIIDLRKGHSDLEECKSTFSNYEKISESEKRYRYVFIK